MDDGRRERGNPTSAPPLWRGSAGAAVVWKWGHGMLFLRQEDDKDGAGDI